jgi:serine/threonine-protein kinase
MSSNPLPSSDSEFSREAHAHPVSQEGPIDLPAMPGELIAGKYEVIARIGVGSMGQVFSALHRELGERVALKFLRREALAHHELVQRFAIEARAAARIRSEHVARVFDVGHLPNGTPYIVMELLEGASLSDLLARRGALRVELAVDYVLQVCEALASAHAKGIVHRDIRPDNLFLTRNGSGPARIKVLDFGVAKLALGKAAFDADPQAARSTLPVGSPAYVSPEQLRDCEAADQRADVWSLGCTLFELVTATTPFDAPAPTQLGTASVERRPSPLRRSLPAAPAELEAVISRCLEQDPDRRYQNVVELATALSPLASERARIYVERCQFLLPDSAPPESTPRAEIRRSVRPVRADDPSTTAPALGRTRARTHVLRSAILGVLAVAGVTAAYLLWRRAAEPLPATSSNRRLRTRPRRSPRRSTRRAWTRCPSGVPRWLPRLGPRPARNRRPVISAVSLALPTSRSTWGTEKHGPQSFESRHASQASSAAINVGSSMLRGPITPASQPPRPAPPTKPPRAVLTNLRRASAFWRSAGSGPGLPTKRCMNKSTSSMMNWVRLPVITVVGQVVPTASRMKVFWNPIAATALTRRTGNGWD